jgi:hypothetical protein
MTLVRDHVRDVVGPIRELVRDAIGTFRHNPVGGLELMGRVERRMPSGECVGFRLLIKGRLIRLAGYKNSSTALITWDVAAVGPDGEDVPIPEAGVWGFRSGGLLTSELFALLVRLDRGE